MIEPIHACASDLMARSRCLVARRAVTLETVQKECIALGAEESAVLIVPGDVSKTSDLLTVRQTVVEGGALL